jgi:hypothetical protein
MSNIENVNIIFIFWTYYSARVNNKGTLDETKKKMKDFLNKYCPRTSIEVFNKIMEGKERKMDRNTLHTLACSHDVCIKVKNHPEGNIPPVFNEAYSVNTITLDFEDIGSPTKKRKEREETEVTLPPSKVTKTTNHQVIVDLPRLKVIQTNNQQVVENTIVEPTTIVFNETNKKEQFKKNIMPSFIKAKKECETLVFKNLIVYLNSNTILSLFRKANNTANYAAKLELYTKLKNFYLKEFINFETACRIEISNFTNSLDVKEYINRHVIDVENILFSNLHECAFNGHYNDAMNQKHSKAQYLSIKMKETPLNVVREKLINNLEKYIAGLERFIQEP